MNNEHVIKNTEINYINLLSTIQSTIIKVRVGLIRIKLIIDTSISIKIINSEFL
jgi:hypothetical protein